MLYVQPHVLAARGLLLLPHYQVKDFLSEGDDYSTCKCKEAIGSLRWIMALERKSHLHDAKSKQNQTDCSYQAEDKVRQVVYYRYRVTCCKTSAAEHSAYNYKHSVGDKGHCKLSVLLQHLKKVIILIRHSSSNLNWRIFCTCSF